MAESKPNVAGKWPALLSTFLLGALLTYGVQLYFADGTARAVDEVKAVLKLQEDAWNRGDIPGFVAHYEMTPDITFYSDDNVSSGWVAVSDRYTKSYVINKKPMGKLAFSEESFTPLGRETVMVRGRWTLNLDGPPRTGLYTILVKKTDQGWKIVHDHTSERKGS